MAGSGLPPGLASKIEGLLQAQGFEVVECRFGSMEAGRTLRVLLDKEGGLAPGDCESAARILGPLLEETSELAGKYFLEVSSAGLERPLLKPGDYERFKGKDAKLKFSREGKAATVEGVLEGLEGQTVLIRAGDVLERISLGEIQKARLVFHYGGKRK